MNLLFHGILITFTSIGAILAVGAVVSLIKAPNRISK